jgi:hypothetical protein
MTEKSATTIDRATGIVRSPRVAYRQLAGGAGGVLLHLDTTAYHGVNVVGALVWQLIDQERTFQSLIQELNERVTDAPPVFEVEIATFLQELEGRGLVAFVGGRDRSA